MSSSERIGKRSGVFAFEGLDRALHEKARLGILSSLVANPEGLVFSELKELCNLTDGNLNRHIEVLEEAGLVEIWKRQRRRRPQTLVRLTEKGRARFLEYIAVLEEIVAKNLKAAEKTQPAGDATSVRRGWSPT
jgi:DNA-binding MarR family transcriptional regulator